MLVSDGYLSGQKYRAIVRYLVNKEMFSVDAARSAMKTWAALISVKATAEDNVKRILNKFLES
jgi:hypothetical protein